MPLLKAKQLRSLSIEELNKKLEELRLELFKEKTAIKAKKIGKNTKRILTLRKTIARILTVLKEKIK